MAQSGLIPGGVLTVQHVDDLGQAEPLRDRHREEARRNRTYPVQAIERLVEGHVLLEAGVLASLEVARCVVRNPIAEQGWVGDDALRE